MSFQAAYIPIGVGTFHLESAQKEFEASLERDSTNGVAWDGLGDVLQDQGKWEEAARAYEEGWKRGNFQALGGWPVMMRMISRSVSRMPRRPRRPMLRMVFSTPLETMPSPP